MPCVAVFPGSSEGGSASCTARRAGAGKYIRMSGLRTADCPPRLLDCVTSYFIEHFPCTPTSRTARHMTRRPFFTTVPIAMCVFVEKLARQSRIVPSQQQCSLPCRRWSASRSRAVRTPASPRGLPLKPASMKRGNPSFTLPHATIIVDHDSGGAGRCAVGERDYRRLVRGRADGAGAGLRLRARMARSKRDVLRRVRRAAGSLADVRSHMVRGPVSSRSSLKFQRSQARRNDIGRPDPGQCVVCFRRCGSNTAGDAAHSMSHT